MCAAQIMTSKAFSRTCFEYLGAVQFGSSVNSSCIGQCSEGVVCPTPPRIIMQIDQANRDASGVVIVVSLTPTPSSYIDNNNDRELNFRGHIPLQGSGQSGHGDPQFVQDVCKCGQLHPGRVLAEHHRISGRGASIPV